MGKEACCQTAHDQPDVGVLDEDLDGEVMLIDVTCDLIIESAIELGTNITPYFESLANAIAPYFNDTKNSNYRTMAIGVFSELANALGMSVVTYKKVQTANAAERPQILFDFAFSGMKDAEPQTRSNAAYLCGILFQNAAEDALE